jgi:hypothetical protein
MDILHGAGATHKRSANVAGFDAAPTTPKRQAQQQLPTPSKTDARQSRSGHATPTKPKVRQTENKEAAALLALLSTLQPQLSERLIESFTRFTAKQGRLLNAAHQQQVSLRNVIQQQQATIGLLQTRCQLAKSEAEVFRSSAAAMRIEMASLKHERRCERAAAAAINKSCNSV